MRQFIGSGVERRASLATGRRKVTSGGDVIDVVRIGLDVGAHRGFDPNRDVSARPHLERHGDVRSSGGACIAKALEDLGAL